MQTLVPLSPQTQIYKLPGYFIFIHHAPHGNNLGGTILILSIFWLRFFLIIRIWVVNVYVAPQIDFEHVT